MWNYARLPNMENADEPLGVFEDEESRAQRAAEEEARSFHCPAWLTDILPDLSLKERILGCVTCMLCGYILSLGSFFRFKALIYGNAVPIVTTVTLGNILSLAGTLFLAGPASQLKRMFHPTRAVASFMYLGSVGVTFFLLVMPHFLGRGFLLILLLLGQYAAITWYSLTYIPFARDILKKCCRRVINREYDPDDI